MIVKNFELNKLSLEKYKIFLFYGKNEGLINEVIEKFFIKNIDSETMKYNEDEFLKNNQTILSEMMNNSFFKNNKIYVISKVSDKIFKIIEEISSKNLEDVQIILKSGLLDKRSKLRSLFEKSKFLITVPFYEDNASNLTPIIIKFLSENNIKLSRESINLLSSRVSGDRENLKNELQKIYYYSISNKNIDYDVVEKLSNLAENYDVGELANNYLCKNTKNVAKILNENNYSDEDCLLILRTLLNKSKRLMKILQNFNEGIAIDSAISEIKPPIFWKEKESVKMQVNSWDLKDIKNKIYQMNELETKIKSNSRNSLNLISDFIVNY